MKRAKGFQEVALSLTEPGHMLLAGESTPPPPSHSSSSKSMSSPRLKRTTQVIQVTMRPNFNTCVELDRSSLSDSTSTMRDLDTESLDLETTQTDLLSAISAPAQVFLASAAKGKQRVVVRSGATVDLRLGVKELTFPERVDAWERALRAALQQDKAGEAAGAMAAYGKINRQVTRDAINEFEKMNYDQKKLLNAVMDCLDRRYLSLKEAARGSRPTSITSTISTGSIPTQLAASASSSHAPPHDPVQDLQSPASDPTFIELEDCLKHFPTIKVLSSQHKMPVVLVYGERKHRKEHRYQEKGKSNKVTYPKEKREFLEIMGLPGKMISTTGLDFTVRPEIDSSGLKILYSPVRSRRSSSVGQRMQTENKENNGSVIDTVIDSTNKLSVEDDDSSDKSKRKLSPMNMLKKQSIGPQPKEDSPGSSKSKKKTKKKSAKKSRGKRKKDKNKQAPEEEIEIEPMLSCDSCSSSDGVESDSDVEEQDVAVPSNYVHREDLQPEPFIGLDLTYITIELEKIGVQNARELTSPFLRMSIRDDNGALVEGTSVQETAVWDLVNSNYLRATGSIHIQLALEALPDDIGVFLELVHHRPHLNCLSTLCYAYLEKEHLLDGEFICELYRPPVDYSRSYIIPYTEKAFFLHLKLVHTTG